MAVVEEQATPRTADAVRDVAIAVGLIGLAAIATMSVWSMPKGSAMFPLAMCTLVFVAAIALLIQSLRTIQKNRVYSISPDEMQTSNADRFRFLRLVALIGAFGLVIPWLGFYVTAFLFLLIATSLRSGTSFVTNLVFSTALMAVIYVIFGLMLKIPTPPGLLAGLF